jgi:hypothetical protein
LPHYAGLETIGSKRGRRRLLQAGIAGTALLFALRWRLAVPATNEASNPSFARLHADEATALRFIIPVMLAGALPPDSAAREAAIAEILQGIDATMEHEPPAVRDEIHELFGLLTLGPTRVLVAGIWSSWDRASEAEIHEFLAGWQKSRFALLRSAYVGLNNLITAAWYANPASWPRIGYPGPPRLS